MFTFFNRFYYAKQSRSKEGSNLTVGGSIVGPYSKKIGEIDIALTAPGKTRGTTHTVFAALTLDEAEQIAKTILSEIDEVRHRVETGKWKHEVESTPKTLSSGAVEMELEPKETFNLENGYSIENLSKYPVRVLIEKQFQSQTELDKEKTK